MAVAAADVAALAQFFVQHIASLVRTKKGEVVSIEEGKRYYPKNFGCYTFLFKRLSAAYKTEINTRFAAQLLDFETPTFNTDLVHAVTEALEGSTRDQEAVKRQTKTLQQSAKAEARAVEAGDKAEAVAAAADAAFFNGVMTTPLSQMQLIYNLRERRKSFLYDPPNNLLHQYDYDLITSRLKSILGDGLEAWIATNSEDCSPEYRPLTYPRISLDEKAQVKIFNTWTDADWRHGWTPDPHAVLPPEIEAYMQAFIPGEADRRTMLAWLRDATFERAEPILVLCGKPGTGKNLFVEHIAGALIGKHNYRSASRGFNKTQFHNNVSSCRLFFLDETNLTPETRETLKSYHNGSATIERKGLDVGDPEKIYASFAVANNHENKIKLEFTDRKFYVPIISDTPLDPKLGADISQIMQAPEAIRSLASYLFKTFRPQEANSFQKNHFFKRLCINSYPYYFRRFIHTISACSELTSRQFNKGSKSVVDVFDLQDNIRHYESQFGERLADFQIHDDGQWTALSLAVRQSPLNGSGGGGGGGSSDEGNSNGNGKATSRTAAMRAEAAGLMYGSSAAAADPEQLLL